MRQLTKEEREAFRSLENNRYIVGYVEEMLEEAKTRLLVVSGDAEFRTIQGHAQALSQLLGYIKPQPLYQQTGKRQ